MAAPQKVKIESRRVDSTILPATFSQPYRLYIIQQNSDLLNLASATNNAGELAYEATVKNEEQDVILDDHETRITGLRVEVDDHEIRITANTAAISAIDLRVTSAETNISAIQLDYVSKSDTSSQSLASPLNVTTSYSVGGTKVIGARQTGWTASTGTALISAFNSSQGYTVSAAYSQAELQAIVVGLREARQRVKALEDMARTHGLIN